jgi:branched-chain amino acid transport system permease protein
MASELLQFLFSALTVGAIYALVALGFSIIYNVSGVINFAQGEFVMLGGMGTHWLLGAGLPLPLAAPAAIALTTVVGWLLYRLAIRPATGSAGIVALIIVTLGASMLLSGASLALIGKSQYTYEAFSGSTPIRVAGAALLPQTLWVLGTALFVLVVLAWFFGRTLHGKALLATSESRGAALLMGINADAMLGLGFALSAALGAVAGVIATPITMTSFDIGVMAGVKGFAAAALGGLGNPAGAVLGGLLVGLAESLTAGYLSSAYKDAVALALIILTFLFVPSGLLGRRGGERV